MCYLELYLPSHFAFQFSYTQLYIGNPSKAITYQGNLYKGAWGRFYFIAGGTDAKFALPQKFPVLNAALSFCTWHYMANPEVPNFSPNYICCEEIETFYSQ